MAIRGKLIIIVSQALINFIIGNMLNIWTHQREGNLNSTVGQEEKINIRQLLSKRNITYTNEQVCLKSKLCFGKEVKQPMF